MHGPCVSNDMCDVLILVMSCLPLHDMFCEKNACLIRNGPMYARYMHSTQSGVCRQRLNNVPGVGANWQANDENMPTDAVLMHRDSLLRTGGPLVTLRQRGTFTEPQAR